jgi:small GTP-binding protein
MSDPRYKVVMLGDSGVGKTALANRIAEGVFTENLQSTVGSQFVTVPLDLRDRQVILELWDTAGQEVYRSLVGFYIRGARGAFLVVDITSKSSFESLPQWFEFLHEHAPGAEVLLFANKSDLESDRVVPFQTLMEFAKSRKVELVEGSARLGQNTTQAFETLGAIVARMDSKKAFSIYDQDSGLEEGAGGCC